MQQRSTAEHNASLHFNHTASKALHISVEYQDIQNIVVLILLLKTAWNLKSIAWFVPILYSLKTQCLISYLNVFPV